MKKETILTYLDQQLTKKIPDYDVAIDWDKKNHTIEVIVRLFAENQQQATINDATGILSEEEVIEFEDGILFYEQEKSVYEEQDYLATIPFESKKGISKRLLAGFVSYLKNILDDGQSDLMDFLTNSQAEVFELNWSKEKLEYFIAQEASSLSDQYVSYPKY